ncbi:transcriptional regulator [Campylobacterota bacterium]|nr:transcriptional regulator [Campylobacterota bacterium]
MTQQIPLEHMGTILEEEFMIPYGLSQNALARAINVPPSRITDIVNGRRKITADTDLRLTKLFRLSEGYFLRFQERIDTVIAKRAILSDLERIVPIGEKAA